ncbi:MAG: rane protein [Bryobacterales bacterium]|jgi:predicted SnoaL-like aldol condensation-catalyzing enzyme|nr:rane protein [Bryobacterales bacterium]
MTRDHIRHTLEVIFDQVFNQGRADLLPGLVSGPYIQHNPLFPNGLDGIMGYIKQAGPIPCEVKRIAIDGDLAFVHVRYLDWGGQETAGVDIFRFDADGKIVEHWDVLQPVPAMRQDAFLLVKQDHPPDWYATVKERALPLQLAR